MTQWSPYSAKLNITFAIGEHITPCPHGISLGKAEYHVRQGRTYNSISSLAHEITETGAFIARTLKGDISGYIREKGIRHAIQLLSFEKSKTKIKTELTPGDGDTVDLTMQIFRRGQRVISVTVNAETDFQAKRMERSFTENPEHMYKFIYSFLMGEGGY